MKPDSPTDGNANSDDGSKSSAMKSLASVISFAGDGDRDYDMDDEVMNFMHSHIHKQLIKFTGKDDCNDKQGMMDGDTKAYFDEVIRGSALFGLLPDDDDKENDESFFSGSTRNNDDNQSEGTPDNAARFQLSRLLLTKKVAEAFMLNRPDGNRDGAEDDGTALRVGGGAGTLSWGARLMTGNENALHVDDCNDNNSGSASRQSEYSIETDLQAERDKLLDEDNAPGLARRLEAELAGSLVELWQHRLTQSTSCEGDLDIVYASEANSTGPPSPRGDDFSTSPFTNNSNELDGNGNRSPNPSAIIRQPFAMSNDGSSNTALEEIRSRLRKTHFDYTSDSSQKPVEATPNIDYRNVLKKKDKM